MLIKSFTVLPNTPEKLSPLMEMAYNLWFCWNHSAINLFSRLDRKLWEEAHGNPLVMLSLIPRTKLEEIAQDPEYLRAMESAYADFKKYLAADAWYQKNIQADRKTKIAYFCCEYGIHESLPIYSGGLGVLAGDHLKSASDLGIPMVGVGLLYKLGYFQQYLNAEGMQQEAYPENTWYNIPVKLVRDESGKSVIEKVAMGGDEVFFQIWEVKVGRISLYLLDTNVALNPPHHQAITTKLYDSDRDVRIRQEILLGVGGVIALRRLGIEPEVHHINEGHSAFLIFERLRYLMKEKQFSFDEASELIRASNLFTTHTPVPAGNERFHPDLLRKYFEPAAKALGLEWEQFLGLGREEPHNNGEEFCMTVLALKFSAHANGVAKLHGAVSRQMWKKLYPDLPSDEVPIGSVTNGIHLTSWLSPQFKSLLAKYTPGLLEGDMSDPASWVGVDHISDSELWKFHEERRQILINIAREKVKEQLAKKWASAGEIGQADEFLDPQVLTIGFARRFATYKRGALFLKNPERLLALIKDPRRPVQFLIAGKSHPADVEGKEVIKQIVNFAVKYKVEDRIVFLENYDLRTARYLVQGVDVWLNNPRRPMEASGTSGMKAAVNGVLNLSILDGWWDEGYASEVGWAIGRGEEFQDDAYQDDIEGDVLYRTIEHSVVPLFYERNAHGLPEGWLKMMRAAIHHLGSQFNTHRMLIEYTKLHYEPCSDLFRELSLAGGIKTKELSAWLSGVKKSWAGLKITEVRDEAGDEVKAGSTIAVNAKVQLGTLDPKSVRVEVYHGPTDQAGHIQTAYRVAMTLSHIEGVDAYYRAEIDCAQGGRYAYGVRALPHHELLRSPLTTGLIKWA
jgi:starch phosphorylase